MYIYIYIYIYVANFINVYVITPSVIYYLHTGGSESVPD